MEHYDILIIGAGAAGMAAARAAYESGCESILLVDRKASNGGILRQCLHRGFGAGMNGPEYADQLGSTLDPKITTLFDTTVLSLTEQREVVLSGREIGCKKVHFHQLILACGCLEIPFGALPITGTRPKGIYTAGQMQEMMNLHGFLPQGPVVILGSGDLGLIMARHITDAGIPIAAMIEKNPACGGMARNRKVLEEGAFPLYCSTTIASVSGDSALESVHLSNGESIPCKTLLIAAGLRPDRSLIQSITMQPWIQLCGNCAKVYPMIEAVVQDGRKAGQTAWQRICATHTA